tara:strand:- start:15773 stop:17140 length:1368 start_codon:yes stop_codon:yes gene_type:complete
MIEELTHNKFSKEFIILSSKRLNLPRDTVCQYFKFKISNYFNMKEKKFGKELANKNLLLSCIKFLGFLFLTLIKSSSKPEKNKKYHFELLIDDIQSKDEIERWIPFEKEFKEENTIFISRISQEHIQSRNIVFRPFLKGYSRAILSAKFLKLILEDLPKVIFLSLRLRLNLVFIYTHLLNDYFYFYSLFKNYSADYLIQDRNLGTANPIKNYLFKENGGKITSCLQKNIIEHNGTALFYDIDIFFTYGEKTGEEALNLGGRIDKIHPVGSASMNNALKVFPEEHELLYDVLFIGQNTTSKRTDWDYYYQSIEWLIRLANESEGLKIAIKHHPTWRGDSREKDIIRNSEIIHVNKSENSYILGLQSKIVLTYGSSMLYEFMSLREDLYFLDPGKENPFINNFVYSDDIVIDSYEKLRLKAQENKIPRIKDSIDSKNYCRPNGDIPRKVINILKSSV